MESGDQTQEIKNERPLTDQEKSDVIKKILWDGFESSYRAFCDVINRTPFHPDIKRVVIQHVDTCYLWGKEGFSVMSFTAPPVPNPNEPEKKLVADDAA